MSHFAVLVIGNDVEGQLAPFHEFECTGTDDEFVQNIDRTAEAREEFAAHQAHDDAKPQTFAAFCESWYGAKALNGGEPDLAGQHKYGWMRTTETGDVVELIDRTNPNKKWDWWVVGGRFSGHLHLKPGASGATGRPGVLEQMLTAAERAEAIRARRGKADAARKGDIDFEAMRSAAAARAADTWDRIHAVIAGRAVRSWPDVRSAFPDDIEVARKEYRTQPVIRDLNTSADDEVKWATFEGFEQWLVSREDCIQHARDEAFQTFAVVKDGQWYERGRMGWWACVTDEKDEGVWQREFASLLDSLPDDVMLTIVDCHI